jgi:hypothetical protein
LIESLSIIEGLIKVKHIKSIIRWTNYVRENWQNKISFNEAYDTSILDIIEKYGKNKEYERNMALKFVESFNILYDESI